MSSPCCVESVGRGGCTVGCRLERWWRLESSFAVREVLHSVAAVRLFLAARPWLALVHSTLDLHVHDLYRLVLLSSCMYNYIPATKLEIIIYRKPIKFDV